MKPYGSLKEGDVVYTLQFDEKILDTFFITLSEIFVNITNIKFISRFIILLLMLSNSVLLKRTAVGELSVRLSKGCRRIGNAK